MKKGSWKGLEIKPANKIRVIEQLLSDPYFLDLFRRTDAMKQLKVLQERLGAGVEAH
jgi:hypothetical protein